MSAQTIQQAIAWAMRQQGTPYVWGGESRREGGFDCSGLIYAAYRAAGYMGIGRTTYQQIKQGIAIPLNKLRPGDLIFPSTGHVGLYIGNGRVLSSPHTGAVVHISSLGGFGYLTARRLVQGGGGVIPPRKIGGQSPMGLPVPASNRADRAPAANKANAAALLSLLQQRVTTIPQPKMNLPKPGDVVGQLVNPLQSLAPRPAPGLPDLTQLPTPSGQTLPAAMATFDQTRRGLLKL